MFCFLSFFRSRTFFAQISLFCKFCSNGGEFVIGLGTGKGIENRIDINCFLLSFFDQFPQFLLSSVRFAVFPVVFLCVLSRGLARIKRNGDFSLVFIIKIN